jgi:aarF domain-containing kinase
MLTCALLATPLILSNAPDCLALHLRSGQTILTTASICVDYWITKEVMKGDLKECDRRSAEKLLKLCSTNGGLYIKAAQYFASLDHVLPPAYTQFLSTLNDCGPVSSKESVRRIVSEDLGAPIESIFSEFHFDSIGSASIAQVHYARLRSTGAQVAVKIQHPNIEVESKADFVAFEVSLKLVKFFFPSLDLEWLIQEFKDCLGHEIDFQSEIQNSQRARESFIQNLKLRSKVIIPSVYKEFSNKRIITMDYCYGIKITDQEGLKAASIDPVEMSNLITEIFLEMIFKHNHFHCDPHPGNLLVSRNAQTGQVQVTILDHGLYKDISPKMLASFSRFLIAVLNSKTTKSSGRDDLVTLASELKIPLSFILDLTDLLNELIAARLSGKRNEAIPTRIKEFLKGQSPEVLQELPREFIYLLKVLDMLRSNQRAMKITSSKKSLILLMTYCLEAADCADGNTEIESKNCEGNSAFYNYMRVYWKLFAGIVRRSMK